MTSKGLERRRIPRLAVLSAMLAVLCFHPTAQAAPPVVTLRAGGAKVVVASASLGEAIDALARAAGFKVTYEGSRPGSMLYNAEIDTPSVAETLFRLIDGQNLNYAVMFDRSGRNVTSLLVFGAASKTGGSAATSPAARPQPFTPPRGPRAEVPVDDDPVEPEPEPTPAATPSPTPGLPVRGPGGQGSPFPPSPFAPRPPFGSPFGPRPSPSPSP
ncbi:MAG: hypothetical protein K1Y01_01540 [Vicinamibacteria bacterium]|nr:hypothetical protein [Vicinamibacteria bacterium]